MNLKVSLLFFMISSVLFSQKKGLNSFEKEFKSRSKKFSKYYDFKKAEIFFLSKKWDSTLVYGMKQLSFSNQDRELRNSCYFLRGYSFQRKKMFKEAKKEFSKITSEFTFYNHTQMYLGEIALEQNQFKRAIVYFKEIEKLKSSEIIGLKKANLEQNLGTSYFYLKKQNFICLKV